MAAECILALLEPQSDQESDRAMHRYVGAVLVAEFIAVVRLLGTSA